MQVPSLRGRWWVGMDDAQLDFCRRLLAHGSHRSRLMRRRPDEPLGMVLEKAVRSTRPMARSPKQLARAGRPRLGDRLPDLLAFDWDAVVLFCLGPHAPGQGNFVDIGSIASNTANYRPRWANRPVRAHQPDSGSAGTSKSGKAKEKAVLLPHDLPQIGRVEGSPVVAGCLLGEPDLGAADRDDVLQRFDELDVSRS